jgi:dUTP pyrophosphatase
VSHRIRVKILRMENGAGLPLPDYKTSQAAGMDIHAAVWETTVVKPGERMLIPTGFGLQLDPAYEAQIRPRSGLAIRNGISMVNSPGTVDADYRGEVQVLLINLSQETFTINRGDRIAQMVIAPVMRVVWDEVEELDQTDRGEKGFGHTGV